MSPPKMPSNRTASHIATMLTAPQNAGTRSDLRLFWPLPARAP
jgi:hypothetical protein